MPVFHSTMKSWCNFPEIFCGGSMEQHFPGFSLQNWTYLTIGFSSAKYVVYAAAFVHKENCVGKSPILMSVYVCVCPLDIGAFQDQCTQTISFEVKFLFRKLVDHLSLVPILRPSWRRLVELFKTVVSPKRMERQTPPLIAGQTSLHKSLSSQRERLLAKGEVAD